MKVLLKKWWWQNNLALLFIFGGLNAQTFQNLVPNGSFETYTQCPNNSSQIYFAAPWTGPTSNSSDYLNACSNIMNVPHYGGVGSFYPFYLNAKAGNAYAGIHVYNSRNYREYLQVELNDSLKMGYCYYIEFYATNIQGATHAINNIAANFLASAYPTTLTTANSLINLPSQITNYGNPIIKDTVKWKKVSGIYESLGTEKHIIIGNFNTDVNTDTFRIYALGTGPVSSANTAYIFVDAVSVYSIDPHGTLPWTYRDTTINEGDSVNLGNEMGGMNFNPQWFTSNGTYIATNAGIVVSPTITSKYIVQYTLCGVVRSDTVKVTVPKGNDVGVIELEMLTVQLKIYPNPAQDELNITIEDQALFKKLNKISIYNNLGQKIREEEINFRNKIITIKTNDLVNGVYSIQLISNTAGTVSKRFVIAR